MALSERAAYLRQNSRLGDASLAAYRAEEPEFRAAVEDVRRLIQDRPGRVSAGRAADWGRNFKVGEVPVYSLLTLERFDQASFLFHSLSRAGDLVLSRNEESAAHDDVFGIRAVVAPADRQAPSHLRQVGRHGRFVVYEASHDGYFGLGDVFASYVGPQSTDYESSAAWLSTRSREPGSSWRLAPAPAGFRPSDVGSRFRPRLPNWRSPEVKSSPSPPARGDGRPVSSWFGLAR